MSNFNAILKYFTCLLMLVFLFSCAEKKYEDYDENDFHDVNGVVTSLGLRTNAFGNNQEIYISYDYFVNDSVYYSGYSSKARLSILNSGVGGAVIIKVHKENPRINFFWKEGFLKNLSNEKAMLLQNHIEKVYRVRMKKKNAYLKKNNLEYNRYYLNDSIKQ